MAYSSPEDVGARWTQYSPEQQQLIGRNLGFNGDITSNDFNQFVDGGRAGDFEAAVRGADPSSFAKYGAPTDVQSMWNMLNPTAQQGVASQIGFQGAPTDRMLNAYVSQDRQGQFENAVRGAAQPQQPGQPARSPFLDLFGGGDALTGALSNYMYSSFGGRNPSYGGTAQGGAATGSPYYQPNATFQPYPTAAPGSFGAGAGNPMTPLFGAGTSTQPYSGASQNPLGRGAWGNRYGQQSGGQQTPPWGSGFSAPGAVPPEGAAF